MCDDAKQPIAAFPSLGQATTPDALAATPELHGFVPADDQLTKPQR